MNSSSDDDSTRPALSAARAMAELLQGNQLQQAIYVAAKLGIADLLADGPMDSRDLAAATGANAQAIYRLLRALAGHGIFVEDAERRFSLTPMAAQLKSGPRSLRPFALWAGGVSYRAFGGLEDSVLTGVPAFEALFEAEFFDYLAAHPESGDIFDEMMSRHTAAVAVAVAEYDLTGIGTIVDVGGGRGDLLAAVLQAYPAMRGVLVDHPRVLERAHRVLSKAGVIDRCTVLPGDVRRAVPSGDGYLLKSVLHGLDDDAAIRVLANCRRAMAQGGVLLLVELVIDTGNTPSPGKLMDLLMLVGCYGRERTTKEFGDLLTAAGFLLANVTQIKHGYTIVEGRAALQEYSKQGQVVVEVNGVSRRIRTDPARRLLEILRDELALTGSKPGCGEGACGACTVLVDGGAARSCMTPVGAVDGRRVTTIEGLADGRHLHPVQQAFVQADAMQCGYCTPGMIMTAVSLLEVHPRANVHEIEAALQGNICRCGAYPRILAAVQAIAQPSDGQPHG